MANHAKSLPFDNNFEHHKTPETGCQVTAPTPPPTPVPERTVPDGEPREFSDDGCYIAPYYRG
jgi:hypothetical protein